jgi:hypothetical protein
MFRKLIASGAIIFTAVIFSGNIYAQFNNIQGYANSGPGNFLSAENKSFISSDNYYAALPLAADDPEYMYFNPGTGAGRAVRLETGYDNSELTGQDFLINKKYVRPKDTESADKEGMFDASGNLASMRPPASSKTSIGVAPFGYLTYKEKPLSYAPIRDFRKEMWTAKNINNKPGLPAAYIDHDNAEDR